MSNDKKRIVVAMSGGVDSSVTAALLKEQGHEVIGVTMQLWDHSQQTETSGESRSCCSLDDLHDARRVAEQLEIPFYAVNFEDHFRSFVVDDFIAEYFLGRTPNPCVRCNQRLKFSLLLDKARSLGADFLATGHYARVHRDDKGIYHLLRAADPAKDQSYFLFTLQQEQLSHVLFPLSGMSKGEVRAVAARLRLRVAEKSESQEICFIPDDDYVRFLEEKGGCGAGAGEIVDFAGKVLGRHNGIYRYTVGQRRGLGIAYSEPLYVLAVDAVANRVVVGTKKELVCDGLVASGMTWVAGPPGESFSATCKIRYRHNPTACQVTLSGNNEVEVRFAQGEKGVTPGQSVVFYREDEVLGGGWIERRL